MSRTRTEFGAAHPSIGKLSERNRHRLLASERRRAALAVLAERSGTVELRDLAASIAEREPGSDGTDEDTVERIQIDLHHVHLPKMDAFGVVDYDAESRSVTP